ncbi:urocortin-3-like [Notechis scutatus]|uniref:Urocortin-3-like n=1 Tax=Notechis scutatus TaxID=8663 RepID=A0A6J1W3S8_9SAUR|nr:urocortin-3-like [Notechis scutatus]
MTSSSRLLFLLLVLSTARTGFSLNADSIFSCLLSSALSQAKEELMAAENSFLEKKTFVVPLVDNEDSNSSEDLGTEKEKRTFPAVTRYVTLAQSKGKTVHNQAKNDRRAKFTLSLDVPTNLMNILFHIAKAKNLRAKAATNAQLMAQIGRRK